MESKITLAKKRAMSLAGLLLLWTLSWPQTSGAEQDTAFKMVELSPGTTLISTQAPERDPFNWPARQRDRLRRLAEVEQDLFVDFSLQAIVWSPTEPPQAVVNKQLVRIGDMVDGALITNINQTRVSLSKNGQTHTMQFDTLDIDFGG